MKIRMMFLWCCLVALLSAAIVGCAKKPDESKPAARPAHPRLPEHRRRGGAG